MDPLARFYTEDRISELLVSEMTFNNPKVVIDLGIGEGSLSKAAYRKWESAIYLATDIDKNQIIETEKKLPYIKIFEANGLCDNIQNKLKIRIGTVDVAICNPPYLKIYSKHKKFNTLFKRVGLDNCIKLRFYTSDLIFFAQNLLLLKEGGELGIILSDSLLASAEFKIFRQDVIDNHTIDTVIQLPEKSFLLLHLHRPYHPVIGWSVFFFYPLSCFGLRGKAMNSFVL